MGSHQNVILSKSNPLGEGQQEFNSLTTNNGQKEKVTYVKEGIIGVLDVFVHQARNLHNICIYHKQDVYAKVFLTSEPESAESTRTINGGGQNPVFNENLRVNARNDDCSLRCEIWMFSRVRNYLEDQLLGFTVVPLSEILVENGKLEKEFELSTNEVCHSASGFVKLSIVYTGSLPDVLEIPTVDSLSNQDIKECDQVSCVLEKIEFPDPIVMNENELMVSEYYACAEIESQSVVNSQTTVKTYCLGSDSDDHITSSSPKENLESTSFTNAESSPSNISESSEKKEDECQSFVDSIKTEPEQKMVQQEIVDMYLKSMKQFTEALAKMNLPMDKGKESPDLRVKDCAESMSNGNKPKGEGPCPKVFYGSRAFF